MRGRRATQSPSGAAMERGKRRRKGRLERIREREGEREVSRG
jgi:hypothetical protein